jgi:hypothetical protein
LPGQTGEKPQKVPGLPFSRQRYLTVILQAVHTLSYSGTVLIEDKEGEKPKTKLVLGKIGCEYEMCV